MRHLLTGLLCALVVMIVAALASRGLGPRPPAVAAVAGLYRGDYGPGAREEFHLRLDGTFEQRLYLGDQLAYQHQGRWRVRQQSIAFDNFMPAFDLRTRRTSIPHTAVDGVLGQWVSAAGRSRIVFGPDDTYAIVRQAAPVK